MKYSGDDRDRLSGSEASLRRSWGLSTRELRNVPIVSTVVSFLGCLLGSSILIKLVIPGKIGLLSNQGEKSINFLFHKGSFKKKKY